MHYVCRFFYWHNYKLNSFEKQQTVSFRHSPNLHKHTTLHFGSNNFVPLQKYLAMKNKLFPIIIALLCCASISCKSVQQAKNLKDCTYSIASISSISAGNIELEGKRSFKDFNKMEMATLSKMLMAKHLPISFTAHVVVGNPNNQTASLHSLDWILLVRNQEVARGFLPHPISVQANERITVELPVNTDLSRLLSTFSMQELSSMIFNFSSKRAFKDDVKIKIKPAIQVGKKHIKTPNYFTVDIPL